jgi:tripartite-type tricarboxylate transporter receptor subunit TctC
VLTDLMSGQVHLIAGRWPHLCRSPVREDQALAVTSLKRVTAAPDIPTIAGQH